MTSAGPDGTDGTTSTSTAGTASSASASESASDSGSTTEPPPPVECEDGVVAPGELCFEPGAVLLANDAVYSARIADLDGNGAGDIVYLISDQIVIRLGNGAGVFGVSIDGPTLFGAILELAHLDSDQAIDGVVLGSDDSTIYVVSGDGSGGMTIEQSFTTDSRPVGVAFGKIDAGTTVDFVVALQKAAQWQVFTGNGAGTFVPGTAGAGTAPYYGIALADLSGDGKADLVATLDNDHAPTSWDGVFTAIGNGMGGFGSASPAPAAKDSDLRGIGAGDIDGDGTPDLAYVSSSAGQLRVLFSQGGLTFADEQGYAAGVDPRHVHVLDLTNDGLADVVVARSGEPGILLFAGRDDQSLAEPAEIATAHAADSLGHGDVNGDGIADLVVTNTNAEAVMLVVSTP